MSGLIYIPISVNATRDITTDYDDIKNGFHFVAFLVFSLQREDNDAKKLCCRY